MFKRRDAQVVLKRIKTDIHNCVGFIQDPDLLVDRIKAVYQKYVAFENFVRNSRIKFNDEAKRDFNIIFSLKLLKWIKIFKKNMQDNVNI